MTSQGCAYVNGSIVVSYDGSLSNPVQIDLIYDSPNCTNSINATVTVTGLTLDSCHSANWTTHREPGHYYFNVTASSFSMSTLSLARQELAGAVVMDRWLVFGGGSSGPAGTVYNTVDIIDTQTNTWYLQCVMLS